MGQNSNSNGYVGYKVISHPREILNDSRQIDVDKLAL